MTATREQIRAFYSMLGSLNLRDMKEELCMQASNDRTTHCSELTIGEMRGLIEHLAAKQYTETQLAQKRINHMRKRIFSMCYSIGWTKYDSNINREVVDHDKLDGWMLKYGYLHKDLLKYDYYELTKLVTQFENLLKSTLA